MPCARKLISALGGETAQLSEMGRETQSEKWWFKIFFHGTMATTDKHRKVYDDNIQSVCSFVRSYTFSYLPGVFGALNIRNSYYVFRTRRNAMAYYSLLWFWHFLWTLRSSVTATAAAIFVRLWKNYGFRKICAWLRNIVHAGIGSSSSSRRIKINIYVHGTKGPLRF